MKLVKQFLLWNAEGGAALAAGPAPVVGDAGVVNTGNINGVNVVEVSTPYAEFASRVAGEPATDPAVEPVVEPVEGEALPEPVKETPLTLQDVASLVSEMRRQEQEAAQPAPETPKTMYDSIIDTYQTYSDIIQKLPEVEITEDDFAEGDLSSFMTKIRQMLAQTELRATTNAYEQLAKIAKPLAEMEPVVQTAREAAKTEKITSQSLDFCNQNIQGFNTDPAVRESVAQFFDDMTPVLFGDDWHAVALNEPERFMAGVQKLSMMYNKTNITQPTPKSPVVAPQAPVVPRDSVGRFAPPANPSAGLNTITVTSDQILGLRPNGRF